MIINVQRSFILLLLLGPVLVMEFEKEKKKKKEMEFSYFVSSEKAALCIEYITLCNLRCNLGLGPGGMHVCLD